MNQYRNIEAAYQRLTRRPPGWIDGIVGLDQIVAIVNDDQARTAASDAMIRRLVTIGRHDPDAITVLLHALAPRLRSRISGSATVEYHTDALSALAMVCLDSDLNTSRLGSKLINRAHNRTWRATRNARHHGTTHKVTTDPCDPIVLNSLCDAQRISRDPAEDVAPAVDLARFGAALVAATTDGTISMATATRYRDLRLARALTPGRPLTGSARTFAYRAGQQVAPIVNEFLGSHAA